MCFYENFSKIPTNLGENSYNNLVCFLKEKVRIMFKLTPNLS